MIQRFHEQMFQRMSPEKLARKFSVMKALAKSVRKKNKENENPINNNMALPQNVNHSIPLKNQQITDLDVVEADIEKDLSNAVDLSAAEVEELSENESRHTGAEEPTLEISAECDVRGSADSCECPNDITGLDEWYDKIDRHWRSLEVLLDNAENKFCRSLEEFRMFMSTSSLLEEIEADLPSSYSLAKPLNHTFQTLTSYRTQTRLARPPTGFGLRQKCTFARSTANCLQDVNSSNPEMTKHRENAEGMGLSKKIEYLETRVMVQKALAEQSEKALILSRTRKLFGVEHVESEKALLLANLRWNAAMQEARKLRIFGELPEKGKYFGQITISQICFEMTDSKSNCAEKYICTATERENVQFNSVINETVDKKLCFNEPFVFKNLHKDFVVFVELFKLFNKEPKKTLMTTALVRKLKKLTAVNLNRSLPVETSVQSLCSLCGFVSIAQVKLRLKDIAERKGDKCILRNVLMGGSEEKLAGPEVSLLVKTDLHITAKQRGFLDTFKQTWHRRWYSLSDGLLKSWLYPEDEESDKAPVDAISLWDCSSAEPVDLETCIRPHSFVVTLKKKGREVLYSADSHEDMTVWVDQLKETIELIRLWKPNA